MKRLAIAALLVAGLALVVVAVGGRLPQAAQAQDEVTRVLVWEWTPNDDGVFEMLSTDGSVEVIVDFPNGVFDRRAQRCGQHFWAAEGSGAVIFTGAKDGDITLYRPDGNNVLLGHASRMACAGPNSFQFSPDHKRAGYIDYIYDVLDREYPFGNLVFYDAESGEKQATFERTTAFALYDDGALMVRIFPDGKGYGAEADIDWWDGAGKRTLVTLEPVRPPDVERVDCGFKDASVARVGDTAYVLVGERCEQTNATQWRLLSVPMSGGEATEIASGQPGGGYFPGSFTANLFPTTDGAGFLITVPSGLTRNTVSLYWVTAEGTVTSVLEGQHVLAERFGERLSEGRLLMLSRDRNTLAFVTTTANQEQTLWLLNLSTTGGEPLMVKAMGVGQRIFQHVWSSNNRLFFVAGSIESSALYVVTPGTEAQRVERGRFFRLAVSYDGAKVATAEWFANPNSIGDDLFRLDLFDVEAGMMQILKEGDTTHNQMIPLAVW